MFKKAITMLVFASVASAQTYYNKTAIDPRIWYSMGNWQGSGTNAILVPSTVTGIGLNFARSLTGATNTADFFFHRSANYVGGDGSGVNALLYAKTVTTSGANNFEWNGLFVLDNYNTLADASQNVALAAQAFKRTSGITFVGYDELNDDTQDSTGSAVVRESDLYANGTQANNNRYIYHLEVGHKNYANSPAHIEYGIKFNPHVDGGGASSDGTVDNAWIGMSGDYKYGLHMTGGSSVSGSAALYDQRTGSNLTYGVILNANYTGGAILLRDDKPIIWSGDQHTTTKYVAADDCLEVLNQAVKLWQTCMDGHFVVNANAILTSPATATLQLGNADAASPVAQTLQAQGSRGATDTDTAGANLIIQSGSGTGSGTGSSITFKTPTATTTGTTQQTETTALSLSSLVVSIGSTYQFGWSGRAQFISPAAATVQVGGTNSATPTAQTFQTQGSRSGTDTDTAGANLTIVSGLGTGSATGSTLTLQTPKAGSTGTTAETAVNAFAASATAISIGNATSNPTITLLGSGALSGTPLTTFMTAPGPIGSGTPSTGAFTTLSASSTVSGAGFSTYLASPPAIGGSAAAAGSFTTVTASTSVKDTGVRVSRTICSDAVASAATGGGTIAAAHTGGTGEFNIAICTIPANVVPAGALLRITIVWYRSATTTNTVTFNMRDSSVSGATSGGTNYSSPVATSSAVSSTAVYYMFHPTTSSQMTPFSTGLTAAGNNTGGAPTVGAVSRTALSYLNFNCADTTSSADTCGMYAYAVELVSP